MLIPRRDSGAHRIGLVGGHRQGGM